MTLRRIALLAAFVALASLQSGCNTQHVHQLEIQKYVEQPASLIKQKNGGASILYERDGHFYTAGYIAYLAGYDNQSIQNFSCYTQTPDEIIGLNAVWVAIYASFPSMWDYRHEITSSLHSLHGGDAQAVEERRKRLKAMIIESIKPGAEAQPWQTGFLIHAYGDSYAHVDGEPPQAYGQIIGHAIPTLFGNSPDAIFLANNHVRYLDFVTELFDALSKGSTIFPADEEALKRFKTEISEQAKLGSDGNRKVTIIVKQGNVSYDWEENEKLCDGKDTTIDRSAIRLFLKKMSEQLDEPA